MCEVDGVPVGELAFLRGIVAIGLEERPFLRNAGSLRRDALNTAWIVSSLFRHGGGPVEHPPPDRLLFTTMELDQVSKYQGHRIPLGAELSCRVLPGFDLRREFPRLFGLRC